MWCLINTYQAYKIIYYKQNNVNNSTRKYQDALISAREKLTVGDVTNLPYMDKNRQSIFIYNKSNETHIN